MNTDSRLAVIEEKLDDLKKGFENHLEHHKTYLYLAWSTCIGLIATLIVLLVTR